MIPSERITILCGAGLCKDAGLPTSVELADKLKAALLHRTAGPHSSSRMGLEFQQAANFLAAYRFLNGGIRFREGMLDRDPDIAINIEQIAMAIDEILARHEGPLSPYISGWHYRLADLEGMSADLFESFLDFIYSQVQNWLRLDPLRLDKLQYLEKLVDICDDEYCLDIFTLNYDLCIETALTKFAKQKFENGFSQDGGWRPTRFEGNDCAIRLYKLHGSLDWVEDRDYGVCSLEFPRHDAADDLAVVNPKPLLIFGTAHKLSPREPFLTLAHAFSQCVLHTSVLVIIGYSFGDDHVNEIIRQGVERNPRLRALVIGPSASVHVAGQSFCRDRKSQFAYLNRGAKQALNEGDISQRVQGIISDPKVGDPFSSSDG